MGKATHRIRFRLYILYMCTGTVHVLISDDPHVTYVVITIIIMTQTDGTVEQNKQQQPLSNPNIAAIIIYD